MLTIPRPIRFVPLGQDPLFAPGGLPPKGDPPRGPEDPEARAFRRGFLAALEATGQTVVALFGAEDQEGGRA